MKNDFTIQVSPSNLVRKWQVLLFIILITLVNSQVMAQITLLRDYENNESAPIGTFQGINFREAGFSGLYVIPNTDGKEFWTISDRGVNVDAANANPAACRPTYDKIYGFAWYAPKIHRIRVEDDGTITILQTITMKRPDGTTASGLLNPTGFGSTAAELASTDTVLNCANFNSKIAEKDVWGIDSEGVVVDKDGYFWICEEGGPTIWKLNPNGVVVKRFTPYANQPGAEAQDVQIDSVFKYRKNNRGFEGIALAPNGNIYAIIQSPVLYPTKSVGEGTRVHRILEIDPSNNSTRMFAYLNDGIIGTGSNQIRLRDWKIGDMAAINDHEFLVIEAALRGTTDIKRIYKIDISGATAVTSGLYSGKTLEALVDAAGLAANGITPVSKTLFMDLLANGWAPVLEKAEGMAILNDSTIAICNDNDYGQISPLENGIATPTTNKSHLYLYGLQGSNKLSTFERATEISLSGNGLVIEDGDSTARIADNTDFGTINGGATVTRTFEIHNSALDNLKVTNIGFEGVNAGDFILTDSLAFPLVIGQDSSIFFTVQFSPSGSGARHATLVIASNDADEGLYDVSLLGTGCVLTAEAITGPTNACAYTGNLGGIATYSIVTTDASAFKWILPSKTTLVSGQGTNTIKIRYQGSFNTGKIFVAVSNACGGAPITRSLTVTTSEPGVPLAIEGPVSACEFIGTGNQVTYSVAPVPETVYYKWIVPSHVTLVSGQGTTNIKVVFRSGYSSGYFRVAAISGCGSSAYQTLKVTTSTPVKPGDINGKPFVCEGSVQSYSVNDNDSTITFTWTVPFGSSIQSGQGTSSITVLMGDHNGYVRVQASNNCGSSSTKNLYVVTGNCHNHTAESNGNVVTVYPSPSSGTVNLNFTSGKDETYQLAVTDVISGVVVFTKQSTSTEGLNQSTVDLTSLRNGLYILHIVSSSVNHHQRIEIKH